MAGPIEDAAGMLTLSGWMASESVPLRAGAAPDGLKAVEMPSAQEGFSGRSVGRFV